MNRPVMNIVRLIVCFSVFYMFSLSASAQKDYVKDADVAFMNESYYSAAEKYKQAEAKAKPAKKAWINYQIGECYRYLLEPAQAETYYGRAIKLKYDKTNPEVVLKMAMVLREQANYKDALSYYEQYLAAKPGDKDAVDGAESCRKAQEWINAPTRHVVMNEIQLNTDHYDFAPSWGDKKHTQLIFSSSREGSTGDDVDLRTGEGFMDLWITTRDNKGKWGEPTILPGTVNTEDNEGGSVIDSKGKILYFTRCPRIKKESPGCDIFFSEIRGDNYGEAQLLKIKPDGADTLSVGHPTLNKTDNLMIFAGDLPGGQGGKDLWYMEYNKREKSWGQPVNLGPKINTPGDEVFPYLDEEENLYFSSTGHIGMGGLDLFSAEKTADKTWDNVENLKYPLNSAYHDFSVIFERGSKTRGFFTSNREGGKGKDDIYYFNLPEVKFTLTVEVKNKETQEPIPGVTITLVGTDGSQVVKTTNEEGIFTFDEENGKRFILKETNYTFEAKKEDYLVAKNSLSTMGLENGVNFYESIYIQPASKDVVIDFPEVQYAYDKAELLVNEKTNAKDSLDYLYNTLIENPTIVIELQAHTDCRGSDAYNEKLSQRRAESCVKYLIEKGIPADRMVAKGYGEKIPRAPGLECETIEKMKTKEEQEAAHQRNRRTQFRVLNFDYKPSAPEESPESPE